MDKYVVGATIGEGQFGSVREAVVKSTGAPVAMKHIRIGRLAEGMPHPVARELLIAPGLCHPYVAQTYEVFPHGSSMVLVMQRYSKDLAMEIALHSALRPLPLTRARDLLRMLLHALRYLHSQDVLHRDVKPANCFLSSDGVLKLGDFGLSRIRGDDMSHEVASRWYRAPELLFGKRSYGAEVDLWSAGCVFAELLRGYGTPLFAGDGDINQLARIFDTLGTPEKVTGITELQDWGKISFDAKAGCGLRCLFPEAPAVAVDLLEQLLSLDPSSRPSAQEALQHPFFVETRLD